MITIIHIDTPCVTYGNISRHNKFVGELSNTNQKQ